MAIGDYNQEGGEKEETGLQKFMAYTKSVELARTERFECRFQLPATLNSTIQKLESPKMRALGLELAGQHYNMTMMCEEVQIPGMVLQNKEVAIGAWNFMRNSNVNFLGNEINITFLTEVNWELRHIFEAWMAHCVNPNSKKVRFPDEQYGTIWINMLSMKGERIKNTGADAYEKPKSTFLEQDLSLEGNEMSKGENKYVGSGDDHDHAAYAEKRHKNSIYKSKWNPTARTDHLVDGQTKLQAMRDDLNRAEGLETSGLANQQDVGYTSAGREKALAPGAEPITAQWELMEVTPKVLNLVPLAWGGVSMARTTLIIASNYWRSRAIDVDLQKQTGENLGHKPGNMPNWKFDSKGNSTKTGAAGAGSGLGALIAAQGEPGD